MRKRWIILAILLLLLIGAGIAVRPTYRAVKAWRARHLVAAVPEKLKNNDIRGAHDAAQAAYALAPYDPTVARAVARVYDRLDPKRAVIFWSEVVKLTDEPEDRFALANAAIAADAIPTAREETERLLAATRKPSAELLFLNARVLACEGKWKDVLRVLRQALDAGIDSPEVHGLLITASRMCPDPADRQAGLAHLHTLAKRTDALGLEALRALAYIGPADAADARAIGTGLEAHPSAERKDKLLALQLRRLAGENTDPAMLRKTAAYLFKEEEDPAELAELGRWLNQQKLHDQTLEIIPPDLAVKRQDLFLVRLDALAVKKQWGAIDEALKRSDAPIEEYLRLLFEARVLQETGRGRRADLAWDRARLALRDNPEKLWFMARYAERLGLFDVAQEALSRLASLPGSQKEALQQLVVVQQMRGRTRDMREALEKLARLTPEDPAVRNDLAYANILLGEKIETSVADARRLLQDAPAFLSYRVTLAAGLLRQGKPQEALELFRGIPITWAAARAGTRVAFAAVLRANKMQAEAQLVLEGLDLKQQGILPEERTLLENPGPLAAPESRSTSPLLRPGVPPRSENR